MPLFSVPKTYWPGTPNDANWWRARLWRFGRLDIQPLGIQPGTGTQVVLTGVHDVQHLRDGDSQVSRRDHQQVRQPLIGDDVGFGREFSDDFPAHSVGMQQPAAGAVVYRDGERQGFGRHWWR